MAVSARFSEMEQAMLEALSLGRTQSDTLREGLRLLWIQEGAAAMEALRILKPEKARELVAMTEQYLFEQEDTDWVQAIREVNVVGVLNAS